ncbi:MAG: LLM class flavin-dependent oxidoreductase [Haloarculaceae archaeon]
MEFGYHHASFRTNGAVDTDPLPGAIERARWLEDEGFGFLSLMDHMWQLPGVGQRDEPFVECYTGLSAIAAATDAIELSALVTCPHYRHPAYLGRAIATLEDVSQGRAVLAIGAGWYEDEYDAMDVAFPDVSTRNRQMRETIELCEAMWDDESPASYEGEHYQLEDFYCEPSPDREIPVMIGGAGEQLTLRATAEYADRWNVPSGDPETYAGKLDVLREHCADLGRDYDAVEKTLALTTVLRESSEAAHDAYEDLAGETERGAVPREEFRGAVGTPAEARDLLAEYEDVGVETYMVMAPCNDRRTRELFVDEVMPAFA